MVYNGVYYNGLKSQRHHLLKKAEEKGSSESDSEYTTPLCQDNIKNTSYTKKIKQLHQNVLT